MSSPLDLPPPFLDRHNDGDVTLGDNAGWYAVQDDDNVWRVHTDGKPNPSCPPIDFKAGPNTAFDLSGTKVDISCEGTSGETGAKLLNNDGSNFDCGYPTSGYKGFKVIFGSNFTARSGVKNQHTGLIACADYSTYKLECQNGGTPSGSSDPEHACDCPQGYGGWFCEVTVPTHGCVIEGNQANCGSPLSPDGKTRVACDQVEIPPVTWLNGECDGQTHCRLEGVTGEEPLCSDLMVECTSRKGVYTNAPTCYPDKTWNLPAGAVCCHARCHQRGTYCLGCSQQCPAYKNPGDPCCDHPCPPCR